MLVQLFSWLNNTLNGAPLIALSGALIWGILSILLSPCHLASIPLIIGFIDEQGRISTKRAFLLSLLFSTGNLLTIALIGVITSLLGRIAGDVGPWGNYLVSGVFIVVGLHLLGIIPLPFVNQTGQPNFGKKGLAAAFLLGLIFGMALGPCTFAFMTPVLGAAFSLGASNLPMATGLVLTYAAGHVVVIILAGTFTEVVQHYLDWNEKSKGAFILKKACGALVLAGGIYIALK
ncbi:MAG: cytochrome c biogenesis protein CcdA [candidate division FCPU426 bacterium]